MNNTFRMMLVLFAVMSFVIFRSVNAQELLPVEETLKIVDSDISLFWHYREPWLGNPDARENIYEIVKSKDKGRTQWLKLIGILGDQTDIPKLLALFPPSNGDIQYIDRDIFHGIIGALALLSNRGVSSAGDILGEMTNPDYWEEKSLACEGTTEPFYKTAWHVLYTYPFAGREDFDIYLQPFLERIDDPQKRIREEKSMRSRYDSVVTREKEMGTWKVQGKPTKLPSRRLPTDADIAAAVAVERERKQKHLHELYQNAVDNLLTNPEEILTSDIPLYRFPDYFSERAEEIFVKVKEKRRDEGMYKEIAFLSLFPDVTEVDVLVAYIESLPQILGDTERQLLAASLFTLGRLAEGGSGEAQKRISMMEVPSYWAKHGISIYGGEEPPNDALTSPNALALASYVSYMFWMRGSNRAQIIEGYLNYIDVQGMERQIMEDALLVGVLNHVRVYDPNLEARTKGRYGEWAFKRKMFDYILRALTPPVTRERLITPSP